MTRSNNQNTKLLTRLKIFLFFLCLVPLLFLVWNAFSGELGANPIESINRSLGDWALRFLLITLAITPLRQLTGFNPLIRFRRMLGLYAFFYATLHITNYVVLDQFFYWPEIWADIIKRPYITIGMVTFMLLLPLAITSTNKMIKRLGGKRWQRLHRLVYPAAIGAVLHYTMMVKADLHEPLLYAAILAGLLGIRIIRGWQRSIRSMRGET